VMYLRVRAPGAGRPLRGTVFWFEVVVLGAGKANPMVLKKKAKSSRAMLEDILNVGKGRLIGEQESRPGPRSVILSIQDERRQRLINAVLPLG
jgi:hypothetical protein